jgi:hypothetical protein
LGNQSLEAQQAQGTTQNVTARRLAFAHVVPEGGEEPTTDRASDFPCQFR